MHAKLIRILGTAILTAGITVASIAFAETNGSATPSQKAPSAGQGMMGGKGMMNGPNMMGGGANMMGMMGMMSAMTRMANTCNAMMESAARAPASPGKPAGGPSRG